MPNPYIPNKRYIDTGLLGQYAGFVSRAAALIMDILVVIVLVLVVYWAVWLPLDFFLGISPSTCSVENLSQVHNQLVSLSCRIFDIATKVVSLLAAPAYFTFMYTSMGQTIGMYILGVRVVRLDGKPMTVLGSLWRYVGLIASMLPLGLGFIWVLFDDRRQCWADKMAGTCVIYAWRAEQNDFLLARVRRFLTGRTWLRRNKPAPLPATGSAYDLVTIAFGEYERLDDILNKIQSGIGEGQFEIVNATVLVKGEDGAIGVLAASDLAVGNRVRQMAAEPLSLPDFELRRILADVPGDSFVIAVVLQEQYGDALVKQVSRMTATMIRRFDLGDTPSPANLGKLAPSAMPGKRALPAPATVQPAQAPVQPAPAGTANVRTLTATPTATMTTSASASASPPLQAVPADVTPVAPVASIPRPSAPVSAPVSAPASAPATVPSSAASSVQQEVAAAAGAYRPPAAAPQAGIYPLPYEPDAAEPETGLSDDNLEAEAYSVLDAEENQAAASELQPHAGALPTAESAAESLVLADVLLAAPDNNGRTSVTATPEQRPAGPRTAKTVADAVAVELGVAPGRTDRLQDLTEVKFVGAAYAQRLYRAGIGTYWELANAPDEVLRAALRLTDTQDATFPYRGVRADARRLAEATDTLGLTWDAIALDDFEPLKGIGKVFELRLYRGGILTYAALAAATPDELAAICNAQPPLNPDFVSWSEQARALARQPLLQGNEGP